MVKQKKWLFFFHGCDNTAALATGAQMLGWEFKWCFLSVLCWCFLGDGAGVGDGVGVDATVDVVGVLVWLVMVTMCNTFLFVKLSRHSF